MAIRVKPVVLGAAILGIVALGAYVWPVSVDHGCPRMTLTAPEIHRTQRHRSELGAAEESARVRYECLQQKLDLAIQPWPSPMNYVQATFLMNDLKALDSATTAALSARRAAEQAQQET
jgi:hypothetical protein